MERQLEKMCALTRFAIHLLYTVRETAGDARQLQQVLEHSSLNVTVVYPQFNDATLGHCTIRPIRRRFDVLILWYDTLTFTDALVFGRYVAVLSLAAFFVS
jgi:hypothetical protein